MKISSSKYWRNNKKWPEFIGKTAKVVFTTKVKVTSPELQAYLPYCFAIVEVTGGGFKKKRYEFMGEKGVDIKKGDKVKFVLRKISEISSSSLINYGIKLHKID